MPLFNTQRESALFAKLRNMMVSRMITTTVVFGSAVGFQVRNRAGDAETARYLYFAIVASYVLSVLYGIAISRVTHRAIFAVVQLVMDTLMVGLMIWVTGVYQSVFTFFFLLNILFAAYVLYSPGALLVATISGVVYTSLILLTREGILPSLVNEPKDSPAGMDLFYMIAMNLFAFFLVALLAGYLSDQVQKAGDALRVERGNLADLKNLKNRIVENIDSGVITIDPEGRLTSFNRAALEITGRPLEPVVSQSVELLFPGTLAQLASRDQQTPWEQNWSGPKGQIHRLEFRVSPLRRDDGSEVGKILIFEDRTQLRNIQDRLTREDQLAVAGRFAAGIAHEIRNPLAAISGSIQILQAAGGADLKEEDAHLMEIVVRETERLNALITDFLLFVRPHPLVARPFSLEKILRDMTFAATRDPRFEHKVQLELNVNHTHPLEADPDQLTQVFWNLMINGAEAMPDGGKLVITTLDIHHQDGSRGVEITVSDTGEGMTPEVRLHLFEPFFSTKTGGTGLGLATVERIITSHEGQIRVESTEGAGTTFFVRLRSEPQLTRFRAVTPTGEQSFSQESLS